jgi:hypothetical protein
VSITVRFIERGHGRWLFSLRMASRCARCSVDRHVRLTVSAGPWSRSSKLVRILYSSTACAAYAGKSSPSKCLPISSGSRVTLTT